MDEQGSAQVRTALREVTAGVAADDALVAGAVRRGRSRLRRRQRVVRAGTALALVTVVGLAGTQLVSSGGPQGSAGSASSGGGGSASEAAGGDAAASSSSASSSSGEGASAPEASSAETGPQSSELDSAELADAFPTLEIAGGALAVIGPVPEVPRAASTQRVAGEVIVVDGGCLGLIPEDGAPTTVVWPSTTTVLEDGAGVLVPGLGPVRVGDVLDAAGSYGGAADGLPAGCPSSQVAVLDQDQS